MKHTSTCHRNESQLWQADKKCRQVQHKKLQNCEIKIKKSEITCVHMCVKWSEHGNVNKCEQSLECATHSQACMYACMFGRKRFPNELYLCMSIWEIVINRGSSQLLVRKIETIVPRYWGKRINKGAKAWVNPFVLWMPK